MVVDIDYDAEGVDEVTIVDGSFEIALDFVPEKVLSLPAPSLSRALIKAGYTAEAKGDIQKVVVDIYDSNGYKVNPDTITLKNVDIDVIGVYQIDDSEPES